MNNPRNMRRRAAREARIPAYLPDMLTLAVRAAPGRVSIVDIAHDDDCAIWHGGVCNCEPDVRLRGDPQDN